MPELPEVRTVVSKLNKEIKGQKIETINVLFEKLIKDISVNDFINKIENKKIESITNIGKFIIFNLSDNLKILCHLRMTGKYRIEKKIQKQKHDKIIFKLSDKYLIYIDERMFGTFQIRDKNFLQTSPLNKLAKEPKFTDFDWLYKKLNKKRVAIKSSLLDQTLIVGLGNIYANETLWESKINPLRPSNQITKKELKVILNNADKILTEATKWGGSTINNYKQLNNQEGKYQKFLKVHNRKNKLCKICKRNIEYIKIGGRGTFYCSNCQI